MANRISRFWYILKNKFRVKAGMGEPLTFLCGSEEELRRVTTWACHVNSDVFTEPIAVNFWYAAPCESWEWEEAQCTVAGAKTVPRAYLERWGALILKHNQFRGTQWKQCRRSEVQASWRDVIAPQGFTLLLFVEAPAGFVVRVLPPSAHERAEALLSLWEWLDGKVVDEEKRQLLQLPEDVAITVNNQI